MTVALHNDGTAATSRSQVVRRWLPVLMYHRVVVRVSAPDPYHICISTADFDAQMAYLSARSYESIPLDEVPRVLAGGGAWKKPVAITFDDGYADIYKHAYPLLKKYGFTATIMLASDHIGGQNLWDRGKAEPAPLLSLPQIRELAQSGLRFGAHGATHTDLTELPPDEVRRELSICKTKLEQLLEFEISTLAYPFGRSTPQIERIAAEVGYTAAFGVDHGRRELFHYSRIDAAAWPGDSLLWRLKVSGIYYRLRQHPSLRTINGLRQRLLQETTA